jgi:hypothetical protein
MANTFDGKDQPDDAQTQVEQGKQLTGRSEGQSTPTEGQHNLGGGIFDPARWKTLADSRLDPKAKVKPATFSKIEVKKPPPDHYVHVHPDPAFNAVFPLYADSESKRYDPYLIAPGLSLPPQVQVNVKQVRLAVTVTDTGRLFLWYVPQTGSEWHESGDHCILTLMERWGKVISDAGFYRLEFPEASLPEPVFPDWSLNEYLFRAFKDRYIPSPNHPVIRRLAGGR